MVGVITIATLDYGDAPDLMQATALRTIEKSERAAELIAETDEVLGDGRADAHRLREILTALLPVSAEEPGTPVM